MFKLLVFLLCTLISSTFAIIDPELEPNWIEHPFVVRLFLGMKPYPRPALYFCAGSLIHPNRALTAAHCVEYVKQLNELEDVFVIFVEHLSFTSHHSQPQSQQQQRQPQAIRRSRLVTKAAVLPGYTNSTAGLTKDIAVLHLEKLPNADETVQWISGFLEKVNLDTNLTLLGFSHNLTLNHINDKSKSLAQAFPTYVGDLPLYASRCYKLNANAHVHKGDSGSPILDMESRKLVSLTCRCMPLGKIIIGPHLIEHMDFINNELMETYDERKAEVQAITRTLIKVGAFNLFLLLTVKCSFPFIHKKVSLFGAKECKIIPSGAILVKKALLFTIECTFAYFCFCWIYLYLFG